jgi:enoyl-CoA hydratase/carnithine racemase
MHLRANTSVGHQNHHVEVSVAGGVAILTLNRPDKLNALDLDMCQRLEHALEEADADTAVRCVVIQGSGRAFCAGADIGDMSPEPTAALAFMQQTLHALSAPERLRKPVIAAVHGYALGGGFELAMASDFIIAADDAQFGLPEPRLGVVPGYAVRRLPMLVGVSRARRLLLLQERLSAADAREAGIVYSVVPRSELAHSAKELARSLAAGSPLAVELIKESVNAHLDGGIGWHHVSRSNSMLMVSRDAAEGRAAAAERRSPFFEGR